MNNNNSLSAGSIFVAFASGAALGASLALLFAPQSGRRTRQRIGEFADEAEDYAKSLVSRARGGMDRAGRKIEEWGQKALHYGQKEAGSVSRSAMENM